MKNTIAFILTFLFHMVCFWAGWLVGCLLISFVTWDISSTIIPSTAWLRTSIVYCILSTCYMTWRNK